MTFFVVIMLAILILGAMAYSYNKKRINYSRARKKYSNVQNQEKKPDYKIKSESISVDLLIAGIDLGTTKSAIGIWKGIPYVIPTSKGNLTIPSVVLVTQNDGIFVGEDAQIHPQRTHGKNVKMGAVKRLLGKAGKTTWESQMAYPQEIAALILAELKYQAEKHLGKKLEKVIIAIPAHYNINQRRATREAAELAGWQVLRLYNEATVAAVAYGYHTRDNKKCKRILVCDFGGGTLDISVIETGEGIYEVKSVSGNGAMGGIDFDKILMDYILNELSDHYNVGIDLTLFQKEILREAVEKAKIELSSLHETSLFIPGFFRINNEIVDLNYTINRNTFEALIKPFIDQFLSPIKRSLLDAKWTYRELDAVLLLGGTSRIPCVKEAIRDELRISPFVGIDPVLGVTHGATIIAGIMGEHIDDMLLLDVMPNSIGIEVSGGHFSPIIPRNTTIPTRQSMIFTTVEDNQTDININVYEGESSHVSENICIGMLRLNVLPMPKGKVKIEITIDIDADGIICFHARNMETCSELKVMQLESLYAMSEIDKDNARKIIESWWLKRNTIK